MNKYAIAAFVVVGAVSGAIMTDMSAYKKAKEKNPNVEFDWTLAIFRYIQAAVAVAAPVFGIAYSVPQ